MVRRGRAGGPAQGRLDAGSLGDDLSATQAPNNWLARKAEAEAKTDVIPSSDRAGNAAGAIVALIVVWFFYAHQSSSTGFFTTRFGPSEAFLFYFSIALGAAASVARAIIGRKNAVRPLDVLGTAFVALTIAWMLSVFPFDFSHFADVLPKALQFVLRWVSNGIVKALMTIGIIPACIMTVYTAILYVFVRRELSRPR